jgi:lipoprotein-anchoring transpeptidase ErfK/SrfK
VKLFLTAAILITIPILLLNPVLSYLNRQTPIDPSHVSSSYNPKLLTAQFHGKSIVTPLFPENNVLSSKSNDNKEKHIEVDLSGQKLYAFEGSKKVHDFLVSTGKWGLTPTGEFHIWTKLEYALMTGGSKALNTFYYLPNVPYTMYFYNSSVPKSSGFGIHGAYWHDNFGHPMSHGCVNMKIEEAKELFAWASSEQENGTGTKVVIYGNTPNE